MHSEEGEPTSPHSRAGVREVLTLWIHMIYVLWRQVKPEPAAYAQLPLRSLSPRAGCSLGFALTRAIVLSKSYSTRWKVTSWPSTVT